MKTKTIIFILLICINFLIGNEFKSNSAENIAQKYMIAYFNGDLETSASLMYPATIKEKKKLLIIMYEKRATK